MHIFVTFVVAEVIGVILRSLRLFFGQWGHYEVSEVSEGIEVSEVIEVDLILRKYF